MSTYIIKAYALPGKEGQIKQLMLAANPVFQPLVEQVGEKVLITSETDQPYFLMKSLKNIVSYQWAYNPDSFDEDQGDYFDKVSIEFWEELQPPAWKAR